MKKFFSLFIIILFILALFQNAYSQKTNRIFANKVTGKSASEYSSRHLQDWLNVCVYLVQRNRGFTPPVAARAYGYVGLTAYEAMISGSTNYVSMQHQIRDFKNLKLANPDKEYHWSLVSNAALSKVIKYLFVNDYSIDSLLSNKSIDSIETLNNLICMKETSPDIYKLSIEYGNYIGEKMIEYSKTDKHEFCWKDENNFPSDYKVPVGPDKWVPNKATIPDALQPYWGSGRCYSAKNDRMFDIDPPYQYSEDTTSLFFKDAKETFELSTRCFNVNNPKDKHLNIIAQYWNDEPYRSGTPSGHCVSIARHIMTKENMKLDKASELVAKVGMSLNDAFIYSWRVKYTYNTIRPITYIRKMEYFKKPNYNTPISTPPFPEYIAGHSTKSGAAMEAMTSMMGDNYKFTDSTHLYIRFDLPDEIVVPRTFNSFYECAEEVAASRIYGGIHFRKACVEGLRIGKLVARNVISLEFKKR